MPTLLGFDPMIQVIHESDVVRAIRCALAPKKRGIYNIAGPDPLPLSHALEILGRSRLPVPYTIAKTVRKRLWSLREKARTELGYAPATSITDTVRSVDDL